MVLPHSPLWRGLTCHQGREPRVKVPEGPLQSATTWERANLENTVYRNAYGFPGHTRRSGSATAKALVCMLCACAWSHTQAHNRVREWILLACFPERFLAEQPCSEGALVPNAGPLGEQGHCLPLGQNHPHPGCQSPWVRVWRAGFSMARLLSFFFCSRRESFQGLFTKMLRTWCFIST